VLGAVGEGLFELGLDEDGDGSLRRGYGGDVANVGVMAARAGARARLCGRVGADALGRALLAFWREEGVDVDHVRVDEDAPTGIYVNTRTTGGPHRFDYHRRGSAGSRLDADDVTDAFLDGLHVLHASGISLAVAEDATRAALERARAAGIRVSFAVNHRPALGGDPDAVLAAARAADIVFLSAEDADLLGVDPALPVEELVVTSGPEGATVVCSGNEVAVPAPAVEVVDAAGAGDALAGAYLAARLAGLAPVDALRRGVTAAALSCRSFGCALSYPTAAELA
jgi:2-dehydro-3-deoxygluconokinase